MLFTLFLAPIISSHLIHVASYDFLLPPQFFFKDFTENFLQKRLSLCSAYYPGIENSTTSPAVANHIITVQDSCVCFFYFWTPWGCSLILPYNIYFAATFLLLLFVRSKKLVCRRALRQLQDQKHILTQVTYLILLPDYRYF